MSEKKGFGTFLGVFVPNVTMMFGVILFMRLGLIVGNVGIIEYLSIIAISILFMVVTALSIAMIVTNMQVGSGGAYFLISRSVGIEMGGALGIGLILSQIISAAVCTAGFAYSLHFLLPDVPVLAIEFATLLGLAFISFISADLALKSQFLIFCLLLTAVGSIFLFTVPAKVAPMAAATPFYDHQLTFWEAFSLMYPAMTGIEAGMAMSGNLRNPSRSLWVGCLFALLLVGGTYALIGVYVWSIFPKTILESSELLLVRSSQIPALIYAGIWGATLSSALGNLLGGPRMIQSLAEDGIAPSILKKGYGQHNEPRYALGLTFLIAFGMLMFTTIDQILPISAMICLMTYGTLNFTAGIAELIHPPSWRPSIRIPWWLALSGAVLALFLMLMISASWTLITILCVLTFYFLVRMLSIDTSFRDLRQNIIFVLSRFAVYHMTEQEDNPHHWHPQLIAFTKAPVTDLNLLRFSSSIAKRTGILTVATILPEVWEDEYQLQAKKESIVDFLRKNEINGLVEALAFSDPKEGIESLIKSYGIGQLQPNTVLLSLTNELNDWELIVNTIRVAKLYNKNLILFRDVPSGKRSLFSSSTFRRRKITVWWDADYTGAFELILSYIHSLTAGVVWRRTQLFLRTVVQDDRAQKHLSRYFDEFTNKSRISVESEIYVGERGQGGFPDFNHYLKGSDIAFLPLRPIEDEEDNFEYVSYLESYLNALPHELPSVLVTSYDALDHSEIYIDKPY